MLIQPSGESKWLLFFSRFVHEKKRRITFQCANRKCGAIIDSIRSQHCQITQKVNTKYQFTAQMRVRIIYETMFRTENYLNHEFLKRRPIIETKCRDSRMVRYIHTVQWTLLQPARNTNRNWSGLWHGNTQNSRTEYWDEKPPRCCLLWTSAACLLQGKKKYTKNTKATKTDISADLNKLFSLFLIYTYYKACRRHGELTAFAQTFTESLTSTAQIFFPEQSWVFVSFINIWSIDIITVVDENVIDILNRVWQE